MSEVSKQTSGFQRSSANSNGGNGGNNKKKDVAPPAKKGVTLNAEDEDLDLDALERELMGPIPVWACVLSGLSSSLCIVWCLTWCALALLVDNKLIVGAVSSTIALFIVLTSVPLFVMVAMEALVDWQRRTLTRAGRFALLMTRMVGATAALLIIKLVYYEAMFGSAGAATAAAGLKSEL